MKQKSVNRYMSVNKIILVLSYFWICIYSSQSYAQNITPDVNQKRSSEESVLFGVVADIQYADKDSLRGRYYRASIKNLKECVADLNKRNLSYTIQLGDIIDGHREIPEKTHQDLDSVMGVIKHLTMPLYHVIGNHDMIAGKEYLQTSLRLNKFYYGFSIPSANGWRFVVLDGNDAGYGVMSDIQIGWFGTILKQAESKGEKVICFCHYALVPDTNMHHYMAQPAQILKLVDNTNCVVAWFAGHDHKGGYVNRDGVHHITLKGMVEAPFKNSYAIVELFPDKIRISGIGKEESRELKLKNVTKH